MVSPVKFGTRNENIRCYNMMIQTSEDIYGSVSYREVLCDQLLKVEKKQRSCKAI